MNQEEQAKQEWIRTVARFYGWPEYVANAAFENARIKAIIDTNEPGEISITCPKCGMESFNHNDVVHKYCGNCHQYHDMIGDD